MKAKKKEGGCARGVIPTRRHTLSAAAPPANAARKPTRVGIRSAVMAPSGVTMNLKIAESRVHGEVCSKMKLPIE